MTAKQRAVVDEATGNINVHGRSGLEIVWRVRTKEGDLLDLSDRDLVFEVGGWLRAVTTPGEDDFSRKLTLTREQIGGLPLEAALNYALHDESASPSCTLWSARLIAYGFNSVPAGGPAVTPGTGGCSSATVTVQQGAAVPTVVVTHIGATGYFDPATMAALNAADVSLASRIGAEEGARAAADTSLTSRISTEETARAAADTSLTTRIGAEETARAAADISLATAAAATYLPLAGGVMAGVLAFVAGTAALPGLAVAGDLNTGMWSPAADTLAWSTGGTERLRIDSSGNAGLGTTAITYRLDVKGGYQTIVSRFLRTADYGEVIRVGRDGVAGSAGIGYPDDNTLSLLTAGSERLRISSSGHVLAGADATYDLGLSGSGRFRDLHLSRNLVTGGGATIQTVTVGLGGGAVATNTASGRDALYSNTTGSANTASGREALLYSTTANNNTASGYRTLFANTTGNNNTAIGFAALYSNTTGAANTASGYQAGRYITDGVTGNATGSNSVFLGFDTRAAADGQTNQIVIGYQAIGNGSNSVTIGNASITKTVLRGDLLAGADATYDLGSAALEFRDAHLSRRLLIGGTAPAGASVSATIQSFGSEWALVASNVLTDATLKRVRLGVAHYTNAQPPFVVFDAQAGTTTNVLAVGGGSGAGVSATEVAFYTAANNTTPTGTRQWRMTSTGTFIPGTDAVNDFGSSSAQVRDLHLSRALLIGGTAPAGAASRSAIQSFGRSYSLIGGDSVTDAADKATRLGLLHYTNAEEPAGLIYGLSDATTNRVFIGGGASSMNAATDVAIWTAANNTTLTGTQRWSWSASGHYLAGADNTYDIGANGSNRVRNVWTASGVYSPNFNFTSGGGTARGSISSPTDGIFSFYNGAGTGFTGIKMGGVTASQPYLKVNGANLQGRLADDTDFNRFQAKLQTHTNAVAETPTATHTLTLYDAAGTAYRVLCAA